MENVGMSFEDKLCLFKNLLLEEINKSEIVFIVPHSKMDYDALASATAFAEICNEYGKSAYIVSDDLEDNMSPSFRPFFSNVKNKYTFIKTTDLDLLRNENELVILTDTNKTNLIPIKDIETYKNIIILDHHKTDAKTVKTDKVLIEPKKSSASELVFDLMVSLNVNIEADLAQRLLSGIYLDTNCLKTATDPNVLSEVVQLTTYGATIEKALDLFTISDFEDDKKQRNLINKLLDDTKKCTYTFAISMNEVEPDKVYESELLSKAADCLLQYDLDVAFVIGFIDREELGYSHQNLVAVKARSRDRNGCTIDVSELMHIFNGGGDENRAACIIETDNILGVRDAINYIMRPGLTQEQIEKEKSKILVLSKEND